MKKALAGNTRLNDSGFKKLFKEEKPVKTKKTK